MVCRRPAYHRCTSTREREATAQRQTKRPHYNMKSESFNEVMKATDKIITDCNEQLGEQYEKTLIAYMTAKQTETEPLSTRSVTTISSEFQKVNEALTAFHTFLRTNQKGINL